MATSSNQKLAHIALIPSAGMGHLTPFLRLAALLAANNNVKITLVTPNPTVSLSESKALTHFLTSHPQIIQEQLHLVPLDDKFFLTKSEDPIYCHMERICQSSHILSPLLSSLSPPLSAVITDMTLAFSVSPVVQALHLPNYILFTSSAKMLSLFLSFNSMVGPEATIDVYGGMIKIPGLEPLPRSWIPPPLLGNTENLLKTSFINNGKRMAESSGILVNTFDSIEQEVLNKLNSGEVIENWPPIMAIGPFAPFDIEKSQTLAWLDEQQNDSVLYVSFGSRTVISGEQLKELGEGLVRSGTKFLWMVKGKKVDKDDDEGCLSQVIGNELEEKLKDKGLVVKSWLNQECILSHSATGGFISHCGWNSVTEAIRHGVPILAWPQHGDQKINADIVERIGLGAWDEGWGWGGERVVNGEEIAEKIKEVMGNEVLKAQATHIREEARRAQGNDGRSSKELLRLIEKWTEIEVM